MSANPEELLAVVMAGGRGERMRLSGLALPKPLVQVMGVPLLLRAVFQLMRFGLPRAVVVVPGSSPELGLWVEQVAVPTAAAGGMGLSVFVETAPLGTLGSVAEVAAATRTTLVVNADNLCALDLRALVSSHRQSGALMTVASHILEARLPYARVALDGAKIVSYEEKPLLQTRVSSGLYVLDAAAVHRVGPGRCDAPELVQRLLAEGCPVSAFDHQAPWMDVNDAAALPAADALVKAHPQAFETFSAAPHRHVVGALIEGPQGTLLDWRPATAATSPACWDTPGGGIEVGESPEAALGRELREELGVALQAHTPIGVFDDVCTASGTVVRHHCFRCEVRGVPQPMEGQTLRWFAPEALKNQRDVSPVVRRTLAWGARL